MFPIVLDDSAHVCWYSLFLNELLTFRMISVQISWNYIFSHFFGWFLSLSLFSLSLCLYTQPHTLLCSPCINQISCTELHAHLTPIPSLQKPKSCFKVLIIRFPDAPKAAPGIASVDPAQLVKGWTFSLGNMFPYVSMFPISWTLCAGQANSALHMAQTTTLLLTCLRISWKNTRR